MTRNKANEHQVNTPMNPAKSIKQNLTTLIHNSKHLKHILQIHTYLLKTSLQSHNYIITTLLQKLSSISPNNSHYSQTIFNNSPSPDTFLYNTIIKHHLNSQHYHQCLLLFHRLRRQDHLVIDSFSLSLVVQACGRSNNVRYGEMMHAHVVKLGYGCDVFVGTGLVEMYVRFGWVVVARKVFGEMRDPDLVSCNVLLAECVRIGEMGFARGVFDEMARRDLVSWNIVINGYASSGGAGMCREALRLFEEMRLVNVVPDKVTVVGVLSACGELGALGMGKRVHEFVERERIEIDVKVGTCLVDMYAKCGDIDNASRVFNGMRSKDVFTWSAMINGLANNGYGDLAIDRFENMISEGVKPNGITFIGVLTACSHIGLVTTGWKYFNLMSAAYGLEPGLEHYGCMVDILCRAGHIDVARDVIKNMPFQPDAIIWRTVLGACKIYKNTELAEEATSEILSLKGHDDGNYVLLSNIYSQDSKWDEAVNIRRKISETGIQKASGNSSIEVDNPIHKFVSGDRSHLRC